MKRIIIGCFVLLLTTLTKAQAVQFGPAEFAATASGDYADLSHDAQVYTLGSSAAALSATSSPVNVATLTATTSVTAPSIDNNVVSACSFHGATADVQIANAFSSLPSSQGIVDGRCYGKTMQPLGGTITLHPGQHLLLNLSTLFTPASASSTVVNIENAASIDGLHVDLTRYASTYSGTVVTRTCATSSTEDTTITNTWVTGANGAKGSALTFSCTSRTPAIIAFVIVDNFVSNGLANPFQLITSGAGASINGNNFRNLLAFTSTRGTSICLNLKNNGLEIRGNYFSGNCEMNFVRGSIGIKVGGTGSSYIQANRFAVNVWDATTNWNVATENVANNFLVGNLDGAISDNGRNTIESPTANTRALAATFYKSVIAPIITGSNGVTFSLSGTLKGTVTCARGAHCSASSGIVTITPSGGNGDIVVTFATALPHPASCVVGIANAIAVGTAPYTVTASTSSFEIGTGTLTPSSTYSYSYVCGD